MNTRRSSLWLSFGLFSVGVSLGCGSDTTGPAPVSLAAQYWSLTLNHHAITLATISPYDTLTLAATPRTVTGAPIPLPSETGVTYTSSDTSVIVSPTGQLKAHSNQTITNVTVIATLTLGGVTGLTLADTALVDVILQTSAATVPVLTTFSIQPAAGDSNTLPFIGLSNTSFPTANRTAVVLDATGTAIPSESYNVRYRSSDPDLVRYSAGTVSANEFIVGHALLTAETTIYGVSRFDSLRFTIGWPLYATIDISPLPNDTTQGLFIYADDTVGVGATVAWNNFFPIGSSNLADVVFDDPSVAQAATAAICTGFAFFGNCFGAIIQPTGAGNIPPLRSRYETIIEGDTTVVEDTSTMKTRYFPQAGTVTYHSALYGTTGVIHVRPNSEVP